MSDVTPTQYREYARADAAAYADALTYPLDSDDRETIAYLLASGLEVAARFAAGDTDEHGGVTASQPGYPAAVIALADALTYPLEDVTRATLANELDFMLGELDGDDDAEAWIGNELEGRENADAIRAEFATLRALAERRGQIRNALEDDTLAPVTRDALEAEAEALGFNPYPCR